MTSLKEKLLAACIKLAAQKVSRYKDELELLKEALEKTDTKDDENGDGQRENLQQQLTQNNLRLAEARKSLEVFENIKGNVFTENIQKGSLVKTDKGFFFVSTSLGKVVTESGETCMAISEHSPLGALLLGKMKGQTVNFNGQTTTIYEVL